MIVLSFKTKHDKEHLLEKAKKMEEYASMIVDCIEESHHLESGYEHPEIAYRHEPEYGHESIYGHLGHEYDERGGRYGYRRRMR